MKNGSKIRESVASFMPTSAPPRNELGENPPTCNGERCTLASERYEESYPHGWRSTLRFSTGKDGELYVESYTRDDWLGESGGY